MVLKRLAQRYIVQQVAKRVKPGFVNYVSQQYGAAAGTIAGIGFSVAAGDYYGALTGLTGKPGSDSPYDRNPPIGYYEPGGGLNGSTPGTQYQALRVVQYSYRNRRSSCRQDCRGCSRCLRQKHRRRSRRRKFNKSYLRRTMGKSRKYYSC